MPSPRPTTLVQVESEDWHPNTIIEINRIQQQKCKIHLLRLPQARPRQTSVKPLINHLQRDTLHTCLIKQAFIFHNSVESLYILTILRNTSTCQICLNVLITVQK